ncbi:hypothetical protein CP02DC14_0332 [Chlamydia psittaci 02DC14]|nr:hypothetical protein CP02DC22_0324 [Chlamydia psittaci 02DC22]EPJ23406.1 hypothetical protein CP08DC60_0932 [Chlamydia psittaci 08DC60]EPJ99949.1 hypothetical protein CP02DC14_0332 [Chlamydia psittaci 02DC14]
MAKIEPPIDQTESSFLELALLEAFLFIILKNCDIEVVSRCPV